MAIVGLATFLDRWRSFSIPTSGHRYGLDYASFVVCRAGLFHSLVMSGIDYRSMVNILLVKQRQRYRPGALCRCV